MGDRGDADAEAWVLTTEPGRALLAEVVPVAAPGPADLARWRRLAEPPAVSAALRLAACRARARAKFTRADALWLEPVGLEQATAEPVARHKARRFHEAGGPVVDLCSGIGGDALALASAATVWAVDRDRGMCRRLRWNAEAYAVSDRLAVVQGRAESFALAAPVLVHVDPDRRAGSAEGKRSISLRGYVPGLDWLRSLPGRAAGGAIKLGPASEFAAPFGTGGFELELVSLAGECKEATAWFGMLAACRRRATCLPSGTSFTDRDGPLDATISVSGSDAWMYDPDPALVRAGLLDAFAAVHGLSRCAAGVDFLSGPSRIDSPLLAAFETLEEFPLDLRTLRRAVASGGFGTLEIKTKGLDLRPEAVRRQLRPQGPHAAALLLYGGRGAGARAVIARRVG